MNKAFLFLCSFCLLFGCRGQHQDQTDPVSIAQNKGTIHSYSYTVNKPDRTRSLPEMLTEVSGNVWIDLNHLALIEDLTPNLYIVRLTDSGVTIEKNISFEQTDKEKTDIEDVAFTGDAFYALWSHGVLFKITQWQGAPVITRLETGLDKKNNTEGLCFDPLSKNLFIACKGDAGEEEEKKSDKAVYQFDPVGGKLLSPPFMTIHKKDFIAITGDKLKFNPSAIAVHPLTGEIYMLSTRDNKGMAVFTREGLLKSYEAIDAEIMAQPEGICFAPNGTLYISSEGKRGTAAKLLEFIPHIN